MTDIQDFIAAQLKGRTDTTGNFPQGFAPGGWQGIDIPTRRDLDYVEKHSTYDDVVSDFVRSFGLHKLPDGTFGRPSDEMRLAHPTPPGVPIPMARPEEANMTPQQLQEYDQQYPDASNAILREYMKRLEGQPDDKSDDIFGY